MSDTQKALQLNPRSVEPYCVAASIQVALNEHQRALEYLKEALELTSPIDFRRRSIEEVMNGSKLALKIGHSSTPQDMASVETGHMNSDTKLASNMEHSVHADVSVDSDEEQQEEQKQLESQLDLPFDNADFMHLQKDLTEQMCNIGGNEFQAKLMKLNDIPAVQAFQRKALKGEKPDYNDYMALMKDRKFQKYNAVMTEIAKNPKFESVTAKFAAMDWMGAYKELQKDPEALQLYMKAFEALDEDEDQDADQDHNVVHAEVEGTTNK